MFVDDSSNSYCFFFSLERPFILDGYGIMHGEVLNIVLKYV